MRLPWRRIVRGLALFGLLAAAGCHAPRTAAKGVLRIGTVADSPPLAFRQDGRWCGVEADLGRALAARLGLKPIFVACDPARLQDALLDGQVDVLMAGLTLTEERRVRMDFASPYLVVGQVALIRTGDLPRYNTPIKIRSVQTAVGVVEGSPGDAFVSRYFTRAARVAFPRIAEAVEALREGKIALLVCDGPAAWWLALQNEPSFALAPALFAREDVAWAFRRGSVNLRESANQALVDWQKDGTLESTLRRWIPFSK